MQIPDIEAEEESTELPVPYKDKGSDEEEDEMLWKLMKTKEIWEIFIGLTQVSRAINRWTTSKMTCDEIGESG